MGVKHSVLWLIVVFLRQEVFGLVYIDSSIVLSCILILYSLPQLLYPYNIIMPFEPEEFLESEISISSVSGLLKAELVLLAKFLNIEFDSQAKIAIIKDLIVDDLIDSDFPIRSNNILWLYPAI